MGGPSDSTAAGPDGSARVWLIAGPTASGKSALALRLAERLGAFVVNADSMQLYRDLRLLTARPSLEEEARAPHRLFGVADAAEGWSVGRWLCAALPEIAAAAEGAGPPAVVVGGTGLYFTALTQGLADIPPVPEAARAAAADRLAAEGEPAFRAALRSVDPEAERRIAPGDRQRLIRALAVAEATGRPLSAWRADTRPPLPAAAWRGVMLEPPRDALYAACDARLLRMLEAGALQEVAALHARALPPDRPLLKALGYREFADHLDGRVSRAQALNAAQMATRRYAKRQGTWFRNQTPLWPRLTAADADGRWRQFLALHPALTQP